MVPVPFDEFEGFLGVGGSIEPTELEFLNLLHIVSEFEFVNNMVSNADNSFLGLKSLYFCLYVFDNKEDIPT